MPSKDLAQPLLTLIVYYYYTSSNAQPGSTSIL